MAIRKGVRHIPEHPLPKTIVSTSRNSVSLTRGTRGVSLIENGCSSVGNARIAQETPMRLSFDPVALAPR
jgi:hypothetical protein